MRYATSLNTVALMCVALSACYPQPPTDPGTGGGTNTGCTEGSTKTCACLGGSSSGKKTCNGSGQYGDCLPCTMGAVDPSTSTPSGSNTNPTTSKCGTCTGCCDGTKCVELASETEKVCGIKGKACAACPTGNTCDITSGKCTKPTSGACNMSCDGCCSPTDGCVSYDNTDSFACGIKGSACKICPVVGGLCDDSGACTNQIAFYSTYQISIRSIDASGAGCAVQAGAEYNSDPMVCLVGWDTTNNQILKDFEGNEVIGCSTYCTSMSNCMRSVQDGVVTRALADGTHVPVEFPGTAIDNTDGVIFAYVYDYDPPTTLGVSNSSDLLGQGSLPPVTMLSASPISGGPYSLSGVPCHVPITFEVAYDFEGR